ncbi:DUF6245 family protein [Streptosporangium sp. NPDC001681]|uniref:DUF6245 family protein n=1 Tax=Streptosporangium sp. NPDC001681 TaxID=3154395 RepID=UPI0033343DC5
MSGAARLGGPGPYRVRVADPLRLVAQDPSTGPIPLAAAHTAEGLQQLLGVIGAGQVPDVETVTEHLAEMRAAAASDGTGGSRPSARRAASSSATRACSRASRARA